jgi:hypothetical protein
MIPGSFAGENSVAISTFHKILGPTANKKKNRKKKKEEENCGPFCA